METKVDSVPGLRRRSYYRRRFDGPTVVVVTTKVSDGVVETGRGRERTR